MTSGANESKPTCSTCDWWIGLWEDEGGIGLCDNVHSDHNQHIVSCDHPQCESHSRAIDLEKPCWDVLERALTPEQ